MFPDFLRLRGKTYDYKILYSSIVKLFLLPKVDDIHVQFVVNLEPPIRQGQTRYPYLIMQFTKEEEMDAEIQMDEEELKQKYDGKLDKKYEAPAYEVVSTIFKVFSGKKVTSPGSFQRWVRSFSSQAAVI
jgi:structure-specific recognition protein 1